MENEHEETEMSAGEIWCRVGRNPRGYINRSEIYFTLDVHIECIEE